MLVFYPFAFSPVCTDQLQVYEQALAEITEQGAEIYGVSCDSTWAQKAFREKLGVSIPQLVGLRAQGRGVQRVRRAASGGFPQRALVSPARRIVRWSYRPPRPATCRASHMIAPA